MRRKYTNEVQKRKRKQVGLGLTEAAPHERLRPTRMRANPAPKRLDGLIIRLKRMLAMMESLVGGFV